jgi:aryl-alcohol dehydrogenase
MAHLIHNSSRQAIRIEAAVLRKAGGPLHIESLYMESPMDDEVLVRITASGICHTDIDFVDSWGGDAVVLGHEGSGIVEQVGKDVKSVRRGDHVVLSYQSCGRCGQCKNGHPAHCEHFWEANFEFRRLDGSNALQRNDVRGHFFGQSSFATHALATERNIVKVPKNLSLEVLAPLGCGLQTGAGTVINSLKVSTGESIAVFGTGSVGLASVMAARLVGANPIIGIDIIPKRLKLALELGATHFINSSRQDTVSRIANITNGVNYVVESTGHRGMQQAAMDALKPGGIVAFLTGESGGDSLPGGRKTLGIIQGDAVPQEFIPKLIKLYLAGKFPFDRLLKFYDFNDINRAIADSKSGKTIKPVLRMPQLRQCPSHGNRINS